jgi:hypothetical protein
MHEAIENQTQPTGSTVAFFNTPAGHKADTKISTLALVALHKAMQSSVDEAALM